MKTAIRDDDPVLYMESETLYNVKGEVPDDPEHLVPIGVARVAREGTDVTIVAWSRMVHVPRGRRRAGKRGDLRRGDRSALAPPARRRGPRARASARPTAPWSPTRAGPTAAWAPRSSTASSASPSTSSTPRVARDDARRAHALQREARAARDPTGRADHLCGASANRFTGGPVEHPWRRSSTCPSSPRRWRRARSRVAQEGRRRDRRRRAARRGRDRQGDDGVPVLRQGHAAQDPGARGQRA
jgi:hypothetical protein